MPDDLKYLATYPTRGEAEAMKKMLEENDIGCFIRFNVVGNSLMAGLAIGTGPTELWVLAKNLERAKDLTTEIE